MDHHNESALRPPDDSLERRLARIENSLERVEDMFSQLVQQKDAMLGLAGDVLDREGSCATSHDERVRGVAKLAQEITEPRSIEAISSALSLIPELEGGLSMGIDILDQQIRQWLDSNQVQGSSVENVAANAAQLIQWLSLDSTRSFLSRELSDSSSVQALALLTDSVRAATQGTPKAVGLFKSARKLGQADSQYALGFVCDLVEQLGKRLSQRQLSNQAALCQEN